MNIATRSGFMFTVLTVAIAVAAAEVIKIPLTYCGDLTKYELSYPAISDSNSYSPIGDTVTVLGKQIKSFAKAAKNSKVEMGFDCNGDGTISDNEKKTINPLSDSSASFNMTFDINGEKRDVVLQVKAAFASPGEKVYALLVMPKWAMTGKFGDVTLFLMLSAGNEFSVQKDTVIFSLPKCDTPSKDASANCGDKNDKPLIYGMPLRRITALNGKYYAVTVNSSGSEMTLEEQSSENYGEMAITGGLDGWKTLVLATNDSSCDLVNSGVKKLPAGEYKIVMGRYGKWGETLNLHTYGPQTKRKYIIQNDSLNTVKIGPPFAISFTASVEKDTVNVEKNVAFVGIGGEKYKYEGNGSPFIISIYKGTELVSMSKMEFG